MSEACKFCHTVPEPGEKVCQTWEETLHYFGCPWLEEEQKVSIQFEQWLSDGKYANVYRHALDLAEQMDASLRRRVRDEIMSVARTHYTSAKIGQLSAVISRNRP